MSDEVRKPDEFIPLVKFNLSIERTFDGWLEEWNTGCGYFKRLGMIHELGFDDRFWDSALSRKRVTIFLLNLADGYLDESNFMPDRDRFGSYLPFSGMTSSMACQALAMKAMTVLYHKLFKEQPFKSGGKHCTWGWILEKGNEEVLAKVVWFFREKETYSLIPSVRNCLFCDNVPVKDDSEQNGLAIFLSKFAKLGWEFKSIAHLDYPHDDTYRREEFEIEDRLKLFRPDMIRMLNWVGELKWFLGFDKNLDEQTMGLLKSFALKTILYLLGRDGQRAHREPESIEEALLGGSMAAMIYITETIKAEQRRKLSEEIIQVRAREVEQLRQRDLELRLAKVKEEIKELGVNLKLPS